MKKSLLLMLAVTAAARVEAADTVVGSHHDFSASGPGPFRAPTEPSPCIFCHASHDAGPGLSNRPDPANGHRGYESTTTRVKAGAPTGASRICLSCHDGTIAVGRTRTRKINMAGGKDTITPGSRAHIGTDLRSSHPVSIRPAAGAGTHTPRQGDAVRYDPTGQLQCTTCHDPHSEKGGDPVVGKFLVKERANSALCLSCHDVLAVSGNGASHARTSAGAGAALAAEGYRSVAEAGCAACHASHGADAGGRLLKPGKTDDDTCLECHGTTGAAKQVGADVARPWAHVSRGRGDHDAAERFEGASGRLARSVSRTGRHVACVDCHDPHAATSQGATAPAASGPLAGVWGIDLNGKQVEPVRFEYEVCLKCHGDGQAQAAVGTLGGDSVRRAFPDVNLRLVFAPSSPSSHPVAAPGRNPDVPSLKPPLTTGSMIYCTDCHASDRSAGAGGVGSRGPHGSIFPHLLERNYSSADPAPESPAAYALCYKCHDRERLLSTTSPFRLPAPPPSGKSPALHLRHVSDAGASCATCHDGHGVSTDAGNGRENAHLISFNTAVVTANTAGRPVYTAGPGLRSCNLTCHGQAHDGGLDFSY